MLDPASAGITTGLIAVIIAGERIIETLVRKKKSGSPTTKLNGELAILNQVLTRLDANNVIQAQTLDKTAERMIDVCMSQERLASNQASLTGKLGDVSSAVGKIPEIVRTNITGSTERIIAAIKETR